MKILTLPLFMNLLACDLPDDTSLQENENSQSPAVFDGRIIDLADDWEGAQSCVVWNDGGLVQCFRTSAEAEALESSIAAVSTAFDITAKPRPAAACNWQCLLLYEHNNFKGRDLRFCDRDVWQNLTKYGFNDQLSSFKPGYHSVKLAENTNGGGAKYEMGNCTLISQMKSGWNDRVSSLRIN